MKLIILALILGIFFNMSSAGGNSWPIGSVLTIVIMGIYLKNNQDKHFEEIKRYLETGRRESNRADYVEEAHRKDCNSTS